MLHREVRFETSHRYSVNGAVAKRGSATHFVLGVHVPPNSEVSLTLGVVLHAPATSVSSHPNYSNCEIIIDAEKGVCSIKEDSPCCLGCAVVGAVDALGFQRDGLAQELPRIDVGLAHLDLQTILIVTRRPNQFKRSKTRTPVAIAGIIP